MYYISSKKGNKFGVTDTRDWVEEFYTMPELKSLGVQIEGVPVNTKDTITVEQLLKSCSLKSRSYTNCGYSSSKEAKRETVMRYFSKDIKTTYPEYNFSLKKMGGCGYYSGYSDFSLCVDSVDLIGIGTHSNTIHTAVYRAELYFFRQDDIESFYDVDILSLGVNEVVSYNNAIRSMLQARKKVEAYNKARFI